MAKTYINTVKYMIKCKFEINGIVDKHDVIGAVFGQSEGLLGQDLDLRELQKNGRIGRIEINSETQMGKTVGEVLIPSSMDMVETSILAAAIESVDKVGPCDSKFEALQIEDTREVKRKEITERAKELLQRLNAKMPESQEIAEEVREKVKVAELIDYGIDKLPAGPSVESSNEIIVVEGRADVLNLLKNNIDNVVGMDGSKILPGLIELCSKKEVTVFIDGDRGGLLNLRKLQNLAKVDFVCQAPDGKEVEELTRKEIIAAIRKKIPVLEFGKAEGHNAVGERIESRDFAPRRSYSSSRTPYPRRESSDTRSFGRKPFEPRRFESDSRSPRRDNFKTFDRPSRSFAPSFESRNPIEQQIPQSNASSEDLAKFGPIMGELRNTMKARLLNEQLQSIEEIEVKDLISSMTVEKKAFAAVFDGIITARLVEAAEKAGIKQLVGIRTAKLNPNPNVKTTIIA